MKKGKEWLTSMSMGQSKEEPRVAYMYDVLRRKKTFLFV